MSDAAPQVTLRPATAADRDWFWSVNNAPDVRRQSVRPEPIPYADHCRWFAARLDDPRTQLFVVEVAAKPVGVLRCDLDDAAPDAVLSLALADGQRGRGLGRAAVRLASDALLTRPDVARVLARIRPDNAASMRAFAAAGFDPAGAVTQDGVALSGYERRRAAPAAPATVLLRCDGDRRVGFGHAMRCSALASALEAYGVRGQFLLRAAEPSVAERLRTAGHTVTTVPPDADEVATLAAALTACGAAALVVDSYRVTAAELAAVRARRSVRTLVIDDLADRRLGCDVVVNPNPWATAADYAGWGATAICCGPRFAPLRPDLHQSRWPARALDPALPRVLLTLGGSQLGAELLPLVQALDALTRPFQLALLVGSDADAASLRRLAATARHRIEVHAGIGAVAELFHRVDLAVSAAGTTCFELAACGVPALLLIGADNQRRGAAAWQDAGVFHCLGALGAVAPQTLAHHVDQALADPSALARRSQAAQNLVDGRGAARVARALFQPLRK